MKTPKIYITIFSLLLTLAIYGQQKKIAVLTFYADKNIDLSAISPTADLVLKNTALAQDPTFILTPVLEKFHKAFFTQYLKNLPFEVIEEKVVHENQKYRDYGPISKKGIAYEAAQYSVVEGYQVIRPSRTKATETIGLAKELGVDGIMFVRLTFDFNKTGVGKFGYVSIRAKLSIDLYDKNGRSIFQFHELAGSKKKAVMVGGVPIMSPKKILPMCESAVDQLMKDLDKKVKRIAKKTIKKLK